MYLIVSKHFITNTFDTQYRKKKYYIQIILIFITNHINKKIYLNSIIKPEGGTKKDIHSRLGKARRVY